MIYYQITFIIIIVKKSKKKSKINNCTAKERKRKNFSKMNVVGDDDDENVANDNNNDKDKQKSIASSIQIHDTIHDSVTDPISFEPMVDAVSLPCGHSFSQSTISEWLLSHSQCPLCNAPAKIDDARPNFALRAVVDAIQSAPPPPPIAPSPAVVVPSPAPLPTLASSALAPLVPPAAKDAFLDSFEVREIRPPECSLVANVLAQSFSESDDIFCGYVWPDRSVDSMRWFFGVIADYCVRDGRAWAIFAPNGALVGAALWQSPQLPGEAGVSIMSMIKSGLLLSPFIMGIRPTARTLKSLGSTERSHLEEMGEAPHWSLYTCAVLPRLRNRGVGTKLLAPVLADADAAGVPVYVDTATPRNEKFFERSGFVTKRKLCGLKDGVPPFSVLVRPPTADNK